MSSSSNTEINGLAGNVSGSGFGRSWAWHSSLRYPSPFLDLASLYLPRTIKELFHLCRYYYTTSPIINPIVRKLAVYPITEQYIEDPDPELKQYWENYCNKVLRLPEFNIECGLDYFTYGNCYVYIYFPIIKTLTCNNCKKEEKIENCSYVWRSLRFDLKCSFCNAQTREAAVKEYPKKSMNEIKLIRLPPELIDIENNPLTGQKDYFLTIPRVTRNEILIGKKVIIEGTPEIFIESMRQNKRMKLTPGKFFHFQRQSISQVDWLGYGEPIITPVLKDNFYFQILRKAQEAVLHSAIVPLRFVFPQSGDAQTSPYTNVNLLRWMNNMKSEFIKWRRDPNHVGFVPMPVGSQVVGADGKALTLFQELSLQADMICSGMGVPLEFYKGGLSWSGSNMSLRMMQTEFIGYRAKMKVLNEDFILGTIADYLGKNRVKVSFAEFKMADDLQRSALEFQMYQSQVMSGDTVVKGMGHDYVIEQEKINVERQNQTTIQRKNQIAQANIAGEAQLIQAKWQAQAQKKMQMMQVQPQLASQTQQQQQSQGASPMETMQSPLQNQDFQMDEQGVARSAKNEIEKLPEFDRMTALNSIKMDAPDIYNQIIKLQNAEKGSQSGMSPTPEVKPPRSLAA